MACGPAERDIISGVGEIDPSLDPSRGITRIHQSAGITNSIN
jgi:hypothetical protein